MATTAVDPVFVDTNVLVHAISRAAPRHAVAFQAISGMEQAGRDLCISRQVLREILPVLTRPQAFSRPVPSDVAISVVRMLEARLAVLEEGQDTTAQLLSLMERAEVGGKQVHDANIVATMLTAGVRKLLTFNAQDFQRFERLGVIEIESP